MSLKINGTTIPQDTGVIRFGNTELTKVTCNGVLVWQVGVVINLSMFCADGTQVTGETYTVKDSSGTTVTTGTYGGSTVKVKVKRNGTYTISGTTGKNTKQKTCKDITVTVGTSAVSATLYYGGSYVIDIGTLDVPGGYNKHPTYPDGYYNGSQVYMTAAGSGRNFSINLAKGYKITSASISYTNNVPYNQYLSETYHLYNGNDKYLYTGVSTCRANSSYVSTGESVTYTICGYCYISCVAWENSTWIDGGTLTNVKLTYECSM